MAKRLSYQEKKEKMIVDIINKMFEIAGHKVTFEDIKDRQDAWYNDWTMTEDQYDKWKKWGVKEFKKKIKLTDVYAERQMGLIGLNWGLKFENPTIYVEKEV